MFDVLRQGVVWPVDGSRLKGDHYIFLLQEGYSRRGRLFIDIKLYFTVFGLLTHRCRVVLTTTSANYPGIDNPGFCTDAF